MDDHPAAWINASAEPLADGVTLVTLRGELDISTSGALDWMLAALIGPSSPYMAIDVSGLGFCDSQGLAALVAADERARAWGGRLCLVRAGASLRRVLRITGLAGRLLPAVPPPRAAGLPCGGEPTGSPALTN